MTTVIAGQALPLLSQWLDFEGGTLTDLDATPTISVTNIGTGTTALAATTTGVTHPGIGSYGYTWTPSAALAAGAYLVEWAGLSDAAPVTATETVTVIAPATAAATNTSPAGVWYATREDVKGALDFKETARVNRQVDRAIEAASRDVEKLCHRTFYPVAATRYFNWPNAQTARPWRLWLDQNELISLTTLTAGGDTIADTDFFLEPNQYGPPYNRIEIDLDSNAAFSSGDTHQRSIAITGLYGYRDDETTVGTLAEALDASETTVGVDGDTSAEVGVGSVLRVDSERMIVTARAMLDTGQNLGGAGLTIQNSAVTVTVADASGFAVDEVILIDAERMRIEDIAGNNLIVKRAWDGSTIAAHTAGADIYAPRTLSVRRAALGTTAATHASGTSIQRWNPPGDVRTLVIGQAISTLTNEQAGYSRVKRSGESTGERARDTSALASLRQATYDAVGRKARIRGV
ncbi:hypothetical protein GLX30_30435 [Streptomyces sp. Tu 2975]|uniref:hypothetical protein n=1 Tax=Streptomyces sp. Tu 2975 TaxID=2676871 RepID=UPI00135B1D28|nr:hypothetical protein [Streptomyces sp. Tu 2975]QIP87633.1 hypothetical protein GLX30_30435 [Streptomyces sp. Tu 2975]